MGYMIEIQHCKVWWGLITYAKSSPRKIRHQIRKEVFGFMKAILAFVTMNCEHLVWLINHTLLNTSWRSLVEDRDENVESYYRSPDESLEQIKYADFLTSSKISMLFLKHLSNLDKGQKVCYTYPLLPRPRLVSFRTCEISGFDCLARILKEL